jgi:hypothetical protein
MILGTITITRALDAQGDDQIGYHALAPGGEDLPLIESLGMLLFTALALWDDARTDADHE